MVCRSGKIGAMGGVCGGRWKIGVLICWSLDLIRRMVWGVKVMSMRGRMVCTGCGGLLDWSLVWVCVCGRVGRAGGRVGLVVWSIGEGCDSGGGVGFGGCQAGSCVYIGSILGTCELVELLWGRLRM